MAGIGEVRYVVLDAVDAEGVAAFWSEVLGVEILGWSDGDRFAVLGSQLEGGPRFAVQRVPERKTVKNRMHVDIHVDDLDAATARVQELGGRRVDDVEREVEGYAWRVMADPEGNEFDIVHT